MFYRYKKEKTKEELIRERLGKCGHCPFLQIRNAEKEKVYCFYQWKGKCILGLSK